MINNFHFHGGAGTIHRPYDGKGNLLPNPFEITLFNTYERHQSLPAGFPRGFYDSVSRAPGTDKRADY